MAVHLPGLAGPLRTPWRRRAVIMLARPLGLGNAQDATAFRRRRVPQPGRSRGVVGVLGQVILGSLVPTASRVRRRVVSRRRELVIVCTAAFALVCGRGRGCFRHASLERRPSPDPRPAAHDLTGGGTWHRVRIRRVSTFKRQRLWTARFGSLTSPHRARCRQRTDARTLVFVHFRPMPLTRIE
jgi:hypothetical protein